jgi:hypothetical protein
MSMNQKHPWVWRCLMVSILLLAAFLPVTTLGAPDWSVCVVDELNRPLPGVLIRESYINYSAETNEHEEDQYTNAKGCVHFAPKLTRASMLRRLIAIASSATKGVHASFGPYAGVTAFEGSALGEDVRDGHVYTWTGSPRHVASTLALPSRRSQ